VRHGSLAEPHVTLSVPETAEALGVSEATVKRHWTFARAWLLRELEGTTP